MRKFVDYIITGEDSVIKHWLKLGASGFRLDVADELPDEFIFKLRSELKKKFKNYALIGEVWERCHNQKATERNVNMLEKGLDSVMNYPLKVNVTRLFTWQSKCQRYERHSCYPSSVIIQNHCIMH